jgi:hypothetical protein
MNELQTMPAKRPVSGHPEAAQRCMAVDLQFIIHSYGKTLE